jgi:hypothetical protein
MELLIYPAKAKVCRKVRSANLSFLIIFFLANESPARRGQTRIKKTTPDGSLSYKMYQRISSLANGLLKIGHQVFGILYAHTKPDQ